MGITVTTELIPTQEGHVRRHTVESSIACRAYDCGFAVPKFTEGFAQTAEEGSAKAHNVSCSCSVRTSAGGKGIVIGAFPNTSLYSTNTVIPAISYEIPVGKTALETTVISCSRQ